VLVANEITRFLTIPLLKAIALAFPITDLDEAAAQVRKFIAEIEDVRISSRPRASSARSRTATSADQGGVRAARGGPATFVERNS